MAAVGATLDRVQEALQFRDDARERQKSDRFLSRSPLDRALWLTLDSFLLVLHGDQELRLNRVWPISRTRAEVTGEFAIQSLAIILKLRLSYSPADETLIRVHDARLVIKVDLSFSSRGRIPPTLFLLQETHRNCSLPVWLNPAVFVG